MRILVVTLTRNEERIMPWFLRNYDFADELHIFDNASTDATRDIIASCPKAKLFPYDTEGVLKDSVHRDIKNSHYKTQEGFDWIIVVDADEFLYHPKGVRQYLEGFAGDLPRTQGYQMVGDSWPGWPGLGMGIEDKDQLTQVVTEGVPDHMYSKFCVFRPSVDIRYGAGAHSHDTGAAGQASGEAELKLLHYRWFSEKDVIRKVEANNISEENRNMGWGLEQTRKEEMVAYYLDLKAKRTKVI